MNTMNNLNNIYNATRDINGGAAFHESMMKSAKELEIFIAKNIKVPSKDESNDDKKKPPSKP